MNGTHVLAAGGGTTFGSALAAVLAASFHMDPSIAAAWVIVLTTIAGFLGSLAVAFARWKWPGIPVGPLAGQ